MNVQRQMMLGKIHKRLIKVKTNSLNEATFESIQARQSELEIESLIKHTLNQIDWVHFSIYIDCQ